MKLAGKRILVTGADGFIGSHLVEHLVRQGHQVKPFVFYNSFNSWGWLDESPAEIRKSLDVVAGDIRDYHGLKAAMKGCDVVLHLAALIAIPFSYHSPEVYVETNVRGTLNVLQAARELNVERVVHTSTSEVYGTAEVVPINERHPLKGQSPYSASKIGADQMAFSYFSSFELPVTTVRPFNTYGPRQSARAVIPTVIVQIASGMKQIKLGSLTPTRDFSFVQDTVEGFVALTECDRAIGKTVNLGSNFEISIGETAKQISEVMGKPIDIVADETRLRPEKSEVERLWADTKLAQELTPWRPAFGGAEGFRRGLSRTVEWFLEPQRLSRYKAERYNL